jgi:AraC-like DNA-binding protein
MVWWFERFFHITCRFRDHIIFYLCAKALDRHYTIWEVSKDADLTRSGLCRFVHEWLEFHHQMHQALQSPAAASSMAVHLHCTRLKLEFRGETQEKICCLLY